MLGIDHYWSGGGPEDTEKKTGKGNSETVNCEGKNIHCITTFPFLADIWWNITSAYANVIVAFLQDIAHIYKILHCNKFIIPSKATAWDTSTMDLCSSTVELSHSQGLCCAGWNGCSGDFHRCGQYLLRMPFTNEKLKYFFLQYIGPWA